MKRIYSVLLALTLSVSLFTGCQNGGSGSSTPTPGAQESATPSQTPVEEEEAPSGGTLIVRASGDPMSFNPSTAADDNLYGPAQNMFNRLVKLDTSKSVIPDLAESYGVSEDGLTITFYLKQNAKWHDGEPVTADDVVYTFTYIKEHSTCYFSTKMADVNSVEALDDYTVAFNMNVVDVSFVSQLGWYATFILPEHIFNNGQAWEDNEASKTSPVGSGPFKLESYKQGESLTLAANPDYHDGAPKLDKVVYSIIPDDATAMQALLNGEVDQIDLVPDAYVDDLLSNPDFRMDLDAYPSPYRLIFNLNAPQVQDVAIREAIAMCINREEVSEKVYGGVMPVEYSAYPSIVAWAANTENTYPAFDIAGASKVLEDAGYKKDADGYYVRGLTIDAFDGMEDMNKLIIANAKAAGIEIQLVVSEFNAWSQKVGTERNFIIESQGGFMGPDPAALKNRVGTGQSGNYSAYSNEEVDSLLQQAAATGDQATRADLYKKIQKIIVEDLPYINVVNWGGYQVARSDLHNLPVDGAGKWGWQEFTYTYFK